ncbi:translation elongation factor Ts [Candidatus Peribacteria bacterium RIFCSPHIGHO2_02_FULL_53_20]|nr:MAG: translation elongation factor Ts [Candidatus Peribacteria bacterium RIFCSPHIGHO2_02_FULL_53_20]OGJ71224.1 MAG: translation elongation factor Ts [Candidatus Peribacteria bacterium RIFCSPLOWO2_12_FULL_53_10]
MPVSASDVMQLRARTGVSINECKKALEEADGNEEKAIEILRKRGIATASKKAGRDQSEGLVFIEQSGTKAAVVTLKCETDFVARDSNFQNVGKAIVKALFAGGEAAAKKVADEQVPAAVQKLGENISLGEMQVIEAPIIGVYVHSNSKIGVVVALEGGSVDAARDVAMHGAALNPAYVRPEETDAGALEKEREIWREQLKKEGKPEAIWDKIMLGKEKKFREENALLTQPFVKDPSKTVQGYLGSAKVKTYVRVAVG